jgi:hypothetical protein
MKKYILAAMVLILSGMLQAQVRFGIKGGLNLAHVSSNSSAISDYDKVLPTFQLGLLTDISANDHFSFQPQAIIQGKGTKVKYDSEDTLFRFVSLDIPLNLLYKSEGFFIGGGPNLGFNLDANYKQNGSVTDIGIGSGDPEFKRFDFGMHFMAGYESEAGFLVGVNYLRGITNLRNVSNHEWRNHVFSVTIGYIFGD